MKLTLLKGTEDSGRLKKKNVVQMLIAMYNVVHTGSGTVLTNLTHCYRSQS